MARPRNHARDAEIVKKRREGWTFAKLAEFFNMSASSVFEAYERSKDDIRLSTGNNLTRVR